MDFKQPNMPLIYRSHCAFFQIFIHFHMFRIQVSPDFSHFATASDDGSVKLWDLQKLDGRSLINKSRQTHSRAGTYTLYLA